jgi:2-polyprenyl-6-methoxyphenol hydroxylase-like FAD-dependent oxidoreductase
VPIGADEVYWYAVLDTPAAPPADADQHAALVRVYRDWHAPVPQLVAATDSRRVLRTELFDRPPADAWGHGPVTLLGDAAHPMTTNLSQGACQVLEDAAELANRLGAGDGVEAALRAYERTRIARTTPVVKQSWRIARVGALRAPLACAVRNRMTALTLSGPVLKAHRRFVAAGP